MSATTIHLAQTDVINDYGKNIDNIIDMKNWYLCESHLACDWFGVTFLKTREEGRSCLHFFYIIRFTECGN